MKLETIRVLIINDEAESRTNLQNILSSFEDIEIVGDCSDDREAITVVENLLPDIILMDVYMPRLDNFTTAEKISLRFPRCAVIIISMQGEQEYLRRAMLAGARDYLVKPFKTEDLLSTIRHVYELENKRNSIEGKEKDARFKSQVITVFGTKGGVGKTTIAVNLAMLLAKNKKKVALIDLDLQFGDVSIFLNLTPRRTISELSQEGNELDISLIESYLISHISGARVLPAPGRPEYAELITPRHVETIINQLKLYYEYIIIDTPPTFNETNLSAIDLSNQILLALSMDMATIKNVKLSLELLESLHQRGKTKLVLNRASDDMGIRIHDAEDTLGFLIAAHIPSDGKLVVSALNKGLPFVLSHPSSKVSLAVKDLGDLVIKDLGYQKDLIESRKKPFLKRIFK